MDRSRNTKPVVVAAAVIVRNFPARSAQEMTAFVTSVLFRGWYPPFILKHAPIFKRR
jgi:hypothetical protein